MKTIVKKGEIDSDLGLNMDEIKKIPKKLYRSLCSSLSFKKVNAHYSDFEIIKYYGLTEGTLIGCKKSHTCTVFIGHKHGRNGNTEEFLFGSVLPRCENGVFEAIIKLEIICGDGSYEHGEDVYRRHGIYINFRSDIKLINVLHASVFSAIFHYLENYLEKNNS